MNATPPPIDTEYANAMNEPGTGTHLVRYGGSDESCYGGSFFTPNDVLTVVDLLLIGDFLGVRYPDEWRQHPDVVKAAREG